MLGYHLVLVTLYRGLQLALSTTIRIGSVIIVSVVNMHTEEYGITSSVENDSVG